MSSGLSRLRSWMLKESKIEYKRRKKTEPIVTENHLEIYSNGYISCYRS